MCNGLAQRLQNQEMNQLLITAARATSAIKTTAGRSPRFNTLNAQKFAFEIWCIVALTHIQHIDEFSPLEFAAPQHFANTSRKREYSLLQCACH